MPANRISLASGVVPEFGPLETISAAACGGFDAVGLWIEPPAWTPQLLQDVKACLRGTARPPKRRRWYRRVAWVLSFLYWAVQPPSMTNSEPVQ
jgi:hypothetical protein